jgi:hypothetical protein
MTAAPDPEVSATETDAPPGRQDVRAVAGHCPERNPHFTVEPILPLAADPRRDADVRKGVNEQAPPGGQNGGNTAL